ncbi:MAG: 23S rRNA (adenine(2503)-C(2))-methyltransferase RlmN [Clostridia bacterium]|nr:23S rRNA (adenine(2503)-C(2))-methyltransferase RlmN [Clostridia bacterium]
MEESTTKIDLLSLDKDELTEFFIQIGEPKYRASQLFTQMHKGLLLDEITNISKATKAKISELASYSLPVIEQKLVSAIDGTVKYLFGLCDGNCIESVVMRYEHGITICISSQVGCRMGCRFCASTIDGRVRDLAPSELLGQIIAAERDLGERISNIVMMGIGEPLDNYGNVIKFLHLVGDKDGLNIGYRHISLSTCGIVPKIKELEKENLPITLSISLHASNDEKRSEIMPINRKYGIGELLDACRSYFAATGRRISFEYTLISGKNDSVGDAEELASLLNSKLRSKNVSMPIHVNLIPVNEVDERDFVHSDKKAISLFAATLEKRGIRATVRRKLGSDINASCGQLRRNSMKSKDLE